MPKRKDAIELEVLRLGRQAANAADDHTHRGRNHLEDVRQALGKLEGTTELKAELGALLPPEATLVVAASMPVRDVETCFPARGDAPRVLANRGANGIDGTIATAYGVATASEGPVVLLLGDVAFAHDAGSLLTARRIGVPLTIVLVDNGGGGIFDFLPVSTQADAYETHVATPTGLDIAGIAQAYGLHRLEAGTLDELRAAVRYGLDSAGTQLVHVRTERAANVALHGAMWDAVAEALRA